MSYRTTGVVHFDGKPYEPLAPISFRDDQEKIRDQLINGNWVEPDPDADASATAAEKAAAEKAAAEKAAAEKAAAEKAAAEKAAAEKAAAEKATQPKPLAQQNKAELLATAAADGVEVAAGASNKQIVAAIEVHRKAGA